jgi:hypothetical protein
MPGDVRGYQCSNASNTSKKHECSIGSGACTSLLNDSAVTTPLIAVVIVITTSADQRVIPGTSTNFVIVAISTAQGHSISLVYEISLNL